MNECNFAGEGFYLCYFDDKSKEMLSYGGVNELTKGMSLEYKLKSNKIITYSLSLSDLRLPDSYYVCVNGIRLMDSFEFSGYLKLSSLDPEKIKNLVAQMMFI